MKTKIRYGLYSLCLLMLIISHAHAYRPFTTEDAGVARKGSMDIESSWDYMRFTDGDNKHLFMIVPVYGLLEWVEVSSEIPYLITETSHTGTTHGIGDINLIIKLILLGKQPQDGSNPTDTLFTFKGLIKTATGDYHQGLGTGDIDYNMSGVVSHWFGDLSVHAMFGYVFTGKKHIASLRDYYYYGAGFDYRISGNSYILAEILGNRDPLCKSRHQLISTAAGMYFRVSRDLLIDLTLKIGWDSALPRYDVAIGSTLTLF